MIAIKKIAKVILLSLTLFACTTAEEDGLKKQFFNPPEATRPWVYWYWYSDNISQNGIGKDLQSMSDVGIGTALIGNVSYGGKTGSVQALTDEWWDLLKYAIKMAGKYNIDVGVFNCPGWSQSGGPWIKDNQAMRYLKTNEIKITGPGKINNKMSIPDTIYQNVAILAYPVPKNYQQFIDNTAASISSNIPGDSLEYVIDKNVQTVFQFPQEAIDKDKFILDIRIPQKVKARSLSFYPAPTHFRVNCELHIKGEDKNFIKVKEFDIYRATEDFRVGPMFDAPTTISFPEISTDQFRLIFSEFGYHPFKVGYSSLPGIAEIEISNGAKLEHFIEKQLGRMFWLPLPMWDDYLWEKPVEIKDKDLVIDLSGIDDISEYLTKDGILKWNVPEGDWIIQRIWMIPTGAKNAPVQKDAEGFEVDKMRKDLARYHFNAYIGKLIREMSTEDRSALKYLVIDSYEQGSQNWTDDMCESFMATYNYDPVPWLPVISGKIIESSDRSERFLWDLRRLVADRVATEYAGGLREIVNKNGLKLWMENYGHWGFPGEFLQYGGQSDLVSGEFWVTGALGSIELQAAASAAHIYGKKIVCAESYTSGPPNFIYHPWAFKKRGDWSFTEGTNQTVLHVYIHQPYDDKLPGINAPFGSAFNRHNTWFFSMKSWLKYLHRSNFILQQGKPVDDIAYFIGEDVPKMTGIRDPEVPKGYSSDFINADVIMNRLSVKNGRFVLPDGMSYRLLVLPKIETIRPELLRKIKELVVDGGIIYGQKPLRSPSMQDYPKADKIVKNIAEELWQNCDGTTKKEIHFGKGMVYNGDNLLTVLKKMNILPDVEDIGDKDILWIHRQINDKDVYFLTNQTEKTQKINPVFRVKKKSPELWNAVSGLIKRSAMYKVLDTGTCVYLELNPYESVFVVFDNGVSINKTINRIVNIKGESNKYATINEDNATEVLIGENGVYTIIFNDGTEKDISVNGIPSSLKVDTPWKLTFESDRDVPKDTTLTSLISWTEFSNEAIKYYSGSVIYENKIVIPEEFIYNADEIVLNLEDVGVIAEVIINDISLGNFWHPPFNINISDFIRVGDNHLQIKVTNVWRNRLIGDIKYPSGFHNKKQQFKTWLSYDIGIDKDEQPIKSGLIGYVKIKALKNIIIKINK